MPRSARQATGSATGSTGAEQRDYIADAIAAADPERRLLCATRSSTSSPPGAPAVDRSPAFQAYPGAGIQADGARDPVRRNLLPGRRARTRGTPRTSSSTRPGTSSACRTSTDVFDNPNGNFWHLFRFAGGWDMMSWNDPGGHFLAWQKWKLGWLDPSQLTCLDGPGEVTTTITPLERSGGLKAIVVPTGLSIRLRHRGTQAHRRGRLAVRGRGPGLLGQLFDPQRQRAGPDPRSPARPVDRRDQSLWASLQRPV